VNRAFTALSAAAAALALAGCAATTAGNGQIARDASTAAAGAPTEGDSGTPADPRAPSTSPLPAGQTVTVGKATIPLTGVAKAAKDGDHVCLTLVDDTGCSLEVIDIGATRSGGGSVSVPAPGAPNGWWWESGVPSCGSGSATSVVATSRSVETGFRKIGSKNAVYGHWQVTCQDADLNFDPRLWWLPTSQLAFREHDTAAGSAAAVDKILAGVTFAG
jgi:hypothetical protein